MAKIEEHAVDHVETESQATIAKNARNALYLFFVYVAFYATYMLINALDPEMMAARPFGGLNLALISGMFLIVLALLLALVYMWQCKSADRAAARKENT
jgi:uncharacterized membrane protein (DUF485 family)